MMKPPNFKIIIGLGNPGENYQNTYHNAGQIFISWLIKKDWRIRNQELWNIKHKFFLAGKSMIHDSSSMIHVVRPLTFMNESGKAVKAALRRFRAKPAEMLIVHDDSDIEMGKYKFSFGRGGAGHKGVESILSALKTKNFWRLRIGIGKSSKFSAFGGSASGGKVQSSKLKNGLRIKAKELVLKRISRRDMKILQDAFQKALINIRW